MSVFDGDLQGYDAEEPPSPLVTYRLRARCTFTKLLLAGCSESQGSQSSLDYYCCSGLWQTSYTCPEKPYDNSMRYIVAHDRHSMLARLRESHMSKVSDAEVALSGGTV